jgi:uncharacterized phage infection (PIP) family protein YhgE
MVVLTGLMLLVAVAILGMNAPHFWELWLLAWFAASTVAVGTLALFAALGTLGQLIALLVFVYLALASSGTVFNYQLEPYPGGSFERLYRRHSSCVQLPSAFGLLEPNATCLAPA